MSLKVDEIYKFSNHFNWVSVNTKLPTYGKAVLIVVDGVIHQITYMLEGADGVPDWFESYIECHDQYSKIEWNKVDYWTYI